MVKKSDGISFNLIQNAIDSITHTVELMAWDDVQNESTRLKQAILSIGHGLELLLKERLRQVHPSLIWEDVDKYPNLDARTVGVDKAMHRLHKIGGVNLSNDDVELIKSLRNTRNAIEHFAWTTTRREANLIVEKSLSFVITFAKFHLETDIAYLFRKDDTWERLMSNNYEFAKAHNARYQDALADSSNLFMACTFCGALAVSLSGGSCSICGHWNILEDSPF